MASSKMTLIGMYNWDDTIFSELVLPTGIDKDLFINSLLLQGGEFEVLYPDPNFMKNAIKIWGMKWFRTFAEWLKGTQAEWNPIYNYDRYEDARDDGYRNYSSKNTADYTDKRTADLKDERTLDLHDNRKKDITDKNTFGNTDTTSQTKKSETEHQVAAYDSNTYQPSSKDIIDNGNSKVEHTGTVTVNSNGTDDLAQTGTDKNVTSGTDTMNHSGTLSDIEGKDNNTNVRKAHMYGNIGVTTSAAMLKEFYNIAQWNLYEHMSDVFASELLIPVY